MNLDSVLTSGITIWVVNNMDSVQQFVVGELQLTSLSVVVSNGNTIGVTRNTQVTIRVVGDIIFGFGTSQLLVNVRFDQVESALWINVVTNE